MAKGLTSKKKDYSEWYNDLVNLSGLAEHSSVRGCMVIKPYGYAIWEKMQGVLDIKFKETGHSNAYFPLLIPKSYFSKEATHVKGFAKECAVVTHYRLKTDESGEIVVDENAALEEELIIRPTSETIIWSTYRGWIQSYRDLPLLINQWANVVRWEMRTRLFLRTTEFLWQEGHTAHETANEAHEESLTMLSVYADFVENYMALPIVKGVKTESERFGGALETYTIEALMQDGKALQAGTSHFLGQNFAKAFDVKFTNREGTQEHVWASSWGVSTRLMGALVMAHSDDDGLILPPRLAPFQVVIVPIFAGIDEFATVSQKAMDLKKTLENAGIRVHFDKRDALRPGFKFAEWELKGVPLRIALGPRDIQSGSVEVARRDNKAKTVWSMEGIAAQAVDMLETIQKDLYLRALDFQQKHITEVENYVDFAKTLDDIGGFVSAHWDGTAETEEKIKEETKATIRCIPLNNVKQEGKCIVTGRLSSQRVLFARAY